MDASCKFCDRFQTPRSVEDLPAWDRPLIETQHFAVFVARGALVEGSLSIVPKSHAICVGALSPELHLELEGLRRRSASEIAACYGPVKYFEQGAVRDDHQTASGGAHAHLYLVPAELRLIAGVKEYFFDLLQWIPAASLRQTSYLYQNHLDYLYVEETEDSGYLTTHPNLPRHMFRCVIAQSLGIPEQSNWRDYPQDEIVLATFEKLEPRFRFLPPLHLQANPQSTRLAARV